jgi:hypothetical protein
MPCNKIDCNQGRNCDCDRSADKDVLLTAVVILGIIVAGYLAYEIIKLNSGSPCAVEVEFSGGSKATYIGQSV